MKQILLVGIGGAVGSMLRYLIHLGIFKFYGSAVFPVSTLIVNLSGCFLFGYVLGSKDHISWLTPSAQIFLLTGLLGGFTTFSTFGYDLLVLVKSNLWMHVLVYLSSSVIVGVLAVYLGYKIAS